MDEAARPSGTTVDAPKRGPREIREDIEQTREELGETVEALAAKTDIKGQAKAKVEATKEAARAKVETVKDRVGGEAGPKPVRPVTGKRDAARLLRRHPELFGLLAAFTAGVLVSSLVGS
jgi:hypothetical protein